PLEDQRMGHPARLGHPADEGVRATTPSYSAKKKSTALPFLRGKAVVVVPPGGESPVGKRRVPDRGLLLLLPMLLRAGGSNLRGFVVLGVGHQTNINPAVPGAACSSRVRGHRLVFAQSNQEYLVRGHIAVGRQ